MSKSRIEEMYFSVDVEASGPTPPLHSMLSLGAAAFAPDRQDPLVDTFGVNLVELPGSTMHPRTADFWAKNPAAFAATQIERVDPKEALGRFADWIRVTAGHRKAVAVAYPAGFDFSWLSWYFGNFLGKNPFGISCIDLKTFAMVLLGTPYKATIKRSMPPEWLRPTHHEHIAVADAVEQGWLFMSMLAAAAGRSGN